MIYLHQTKEKNGRVEESAGIIPGLAGIKKPMFWISWKVIGACLQCGNVNYTASLHSARRSVSYPCILLSLVRLWRSVNFLVMIEWVLSESATLLREKKSERQVCCDRKEEANFWRSFIDGCQEKWRLDEDWEGIGQPIRRRRISFQLELVEQFLLTLRPTFSCGLGGAFSLWKHLTMFSLRWEYALL